MKKNRLIRFLPGAAWITLAALALVLAVLAAGYYRNASANPAGPGEYAPVSGVDGAREAGGEEALLPIIFGDNKLSLFGLEITTVFPGEGLTMAKEELGSRWLRHNSLMWSEVEPVNNGVYHWGNVGFLESELKSTAQAGMQSVLVIRSTPDWAQLVPGKACGPIKSQNFVDFGEFLVAAVNRYAGPPYYVKYLEIWNEPDVDPSLVSGDQIFGCWGDNDDPYYGGGYYGEMLKVIYPMIKDAVPDVQIMVGGLLLDCDPRDPPAGQTCKPSKFLEGILQSGAKNAFDGISFHAYDYFNPNPGYNTFGNPNWNSGQLLGEPNGLLRPVMIVKAVFLREVLAAYGATGKFLMNTESGLICDICDTEDDLELLEEMKANYVAQAFATAGPYGLRANLWFTLYGWRNSGLLYPDNEPRPAFHAYAYSQSVLWDAAFTGLTPAYVKVAGYTFTRLDGTKIWVMWATDGGPRMIELPATPIDIRDIYGDPVAINGGNVTLTVEPYYIEMP